MERKVPTCVAREGQKSEETFPLWATIPHNSGFPFPRSGVISHNFRISFPGSGAVPHNSGFPFPPCHHDLRHSRWRGGVSLTQSSPTASLRAKDHSLEWAERSDERLAMRADKRGHATHEQRVV